MAADETSGTENERVNDAGNNSPPADANNRTFLIAASLLTGTLLLLSLFTVGYLLSDRAGGRGELGLQGRAGLVLAKRDDALGLLGLGDAVAVAGGGGLVAGRGLRVAARVL